MCKIKDFEEYPVNIIYSLHIMQNEGIIQFIVLAHPRRPFRDPTCGFLCDFNITFIVKSKLYCSYLLGFPLQSGKINKLWMRKPQSLSQGSV